MTSSVFYKFKSSKEPSRVEFDGTGISVFELKRDIIIKSGLGDGTDFDLAIFNNDDPTEEYDDDTAIIPRSTTVVARRLPAIKRGAGRAQRYMTGKMPVNAKNASRKEQANKSGTKATTTNGVSQMNKAQTEEERLQAMFQVQNEQWSGQLEEMAKQTKVFTGKKTSEGEPPEGYLCYRCGKKGHWIKECPTNDDPNFENRRLFKRTTGIPRSFLKTVEKPVDGGDDAEPPPGVRLDADNKWVVVEPDKASWEQFQAKTKSSAAAQKLLAMGDKELQDRGLECPIDKRLFIDPMKTPCCKKTYCNDCITNALIESDFTCPGCQTEAVLIDDLTIDDETSQKITAYLKEKAEVKNEAAKTERERSNSPNVTKDETIFVVETSKPKSPSPKASPSSPGLQSKSPVKSPPAPSSTPNLEKTIPTGPNTKKRPADELLENPKIPKGPKAMQQKETEKQAALMQQQMMNGMNGFPNMFPNMQNQFYGNGFNGMPMMPNFGMPMGGMNPMMPMNPMMMNGGFGFPNMYNNNSAGGNFGKGGGMGMNMQNGGNMNGVGRGGNINGVGAGVGGAAGGFPNQQKTVFAEPLPNEEDNAYFRKPVNPHRHQGRQRRARPSDYREL